MSQGNLARWRKFRGLTQEDVAKQLGISTSRYAKYEKNPYNAKFVYIVEICKILNISAQEFFYDKN